MSIKEQYWKYSLIVIILFMGVIIFRQITPFLGGLLGAFTIYILVRTQMHHLTEKKKMKRSISALLITAETIFVFLVPLGLTIWMIVNKLQDINLAPQTFVEPIQQVAGFIKEKTGYDLNGKSEEEIRQVCKELKMEEIDDTMGKGKLIDEIFGEFCEGTYLSLIHI